MADYRDRNYLMGANQQRLLAVGASGPSDGDFSSVVFLSHFDGTNGSTTLTNVVQPLGRGTTIAAVGTAALSTTHALFGPTSLSLPGSTGNYAESTPSSDYTLPALFTVDMAIWPTTANGGSAWMYFDTDAASPNEFSITDVVGTLNILVGNATIISTGSLTVGAWNQIRVSRDASLTYLFIGGVLQNSSATNVASSVGNTGFRIGQKSGNAGGYTNPPSFIDEVRVTKGICRSTTNYSVDVVAFPDS